VVVGALPASNLDRARSIVQAEIRTMDAACGRFAAGSELTQVNQSDGKWVSVTSLLGEVIDVAVDAAEHSDGALDPTCARILEVLGPCSGDPGSGWGDPRLPLGSASSPAGLWRSVTRHPSGRAVRLDDGVHLDLSVIANALCADHAAAKIVAELGGGVIVHLGGDVAATGSCPDGGCRVGVVDDGRSSSPPDDCMMAVRTGGLAHACCPERSVIGPDLRCRVAHRVNTSAGDPAWKMVTVAAPSCVDARVAATVAVVRGARAIPWMSQRGVSARLVTHRGEVLELRGRPDLLAAGVNRSGRVVLATA